MLKFNHQTEVRCAMLPAMKIINAARGFLMGVGQNSYFRKIDTVKKTLSIRVTKLENNKITSDRF